MEPERLLPERLLPERLLIERARQRLSIQELAERSGVNAHTISEMERGVRKPRAVTVAKIAEGLGLAPEELLGKVPAPQSPAEEKPEPRRSPIGAVAAAADVWLRAASHPQIGRKDLFVLASIAEVLEDQLTTLMGEPETWEQLSDQEAGDLTSLMSRLDEVSAKHHERLEKELKQDYTDIRFREIIEASKEATKA